MQQHPADKLADELITKIRAHYDANPQLADSWEQFQSWMMARALVDDYGTLSTRQLTNVYLAGILPCTPEMLLDYIISQLEGALMEDQEAIDRVNMRFTAYLTEG